MSLLYRIYYNINIYLNGGIQSRAAIYWTSSETAPVWKNYHFIQCIDDTCQKKSEGLLNSKS